MRLAAAFLLVAAGAHPAAAQHDPHAGHAMATPATSGQAQPDPHAGHDMANPAATGQAPHDHAQMDHAQPAVTAPDGVLRGLRLDIPPPPEAAPPAAAGSGPPRAADAIWGADAMAASRAALRRDHGSTELFWVQADRLEYRARGGEDGYLWDVQGWYGGDIDKIWLKSEGEGAFGARVEAAELQALWSHAVGPRFDVQLGVRQDLTGPERTHAVIGVQGLAPYQFELDAAAFVSNRGDVTARIEAELDQRITQRLILQPRVELALAAQDIPELGVGAGLDHFEAGLRLRYEFVPEFAPYIGIDQEWKAGASADYARLAGEDPSVTSFVAGVRFWF